MAQHGGKEEKKDLKKGRRARYPGRHYIESMVRTTNNDALDRRLYTISAAQSGMTASEVKLA